jgi:hypothetical protein
MDTRTIATLVVRTFGLYLIADAVPTVVWALVQMVHATVVSDGPSVSMTGWEITGHVGTGMVFLLGVYMLLDGRHLIDHLLFVVPGRCARCGYDVGSLDTGVCPECGAPVPRRRTGRPNPPAAQP